MFKIIGEKMVEVINCSDEFNNNLQKKVDNYLENLGLTHLNYLTKGCCLFYNNEKKDYYFKIFLYGINYTVSDENLYFDSDESFNKTESYITMLYSKPLSIADIEIDFENKEIYFDLSVLNQISKEDIEKATTYY